MKIECYGYIESGKMHILGRKRFDAEIKQLKNCDIIITVRRKGKRSSPQNRYYWGCILVEIRHELLRRGQIRPDVTTEDIHAALKLKFNPERTFDESTGNVLLEVGGSTAAMNKDQFSEYLDRIIQWCAESLEISIPEPNTQTSLFNNHSEAA